jgi:hypothetical protein
VVVFIVQLASSMSLYYYYYYHYVWCIIYISFTQNNHQHYYIISGLIWIGRNDLFLDQTKSRRHLIIFYYFDKSRVSPFTCFSLIKTTPHRFWCSASIFHSLSYSFLSLSFVWRNFRNSFVVSVCLCVCVCVCVMCTESGKKSLSVAGRE